MGAVGATAPTDFEIDHGYTLMDILYHIADFQKNILIVLTAFPTPFYSNQF